VKVRPVFLRIGARAPHWAKVAGHWVAALLIPAFLVGTACFFTPREAEDSGNGTTGAAEPAKSPEEVRDKLVSAYETFDEQQYAILLADDFLFIPDRADSIALAEDGVTVYSSAWDLTDEEDAFNRILVCFNNNQTRTGAMALEYTGDPVITDSSVTGFSTFETDYTVDIVYVDLVPGGGTGSVSFQGRMKLFIRDDVDAYHIYRWEDLRKGSLDSWGLYKGQVAGAQEYCP